MMRNGSLAFYFTNESEFHMFEIYRFYIEIVEFIKARSPIFILNRLFLSGMVSDRYPRTICKYIRAWQVFLLRPTQYQLIYE